MGDNKILTYILCRQYFSEYIGWENSLDKTIYVLSFTKLSQNVVVMLRVFLLYGICI